MPKRQDINKIMIIGSGPIIIGQACEFDYSGTQACKALRKLGYEIVLVNSNPATIMTDPDVADITYIEPLNLERLTQIIEKERPDALLPNLGGQSGLNLCSELDKAGVLKKYNVQVIGVQVDAIERGEDRIEFKNAMSALGIGMPKSEVAYSVDEAVKIAEKLKYPVVLRPAYTMGGAGGGMVYNVDELKVVCARGLQASLVGQVLVEECSSAGRSLSLRSYATLRTTRSQSASSRTSILSAFTQVIHSALHLCSPSPRTFRRNSRRCHTGSSSLSRLSAAVTASSQEPRDRTHRGYRDQPQNFTFFRTCFQGNRLPHRSRFSYARLRSHTEGYPLWQVRHS